METTYDTDGADPGAVLYANGCVYSNNAVNKPYLEITMLGGAATGGPFDGIPGFGSAWEFGDVSPFGVGPFGG